MRIRLEPGLAVRAVLLLTSLLAGGATLAGCGAGNFSGNPPSPVIVPIVPYTGPTFPVRVLAGSTPVVGATVKFYAAGTAGNGSAATSLISNSVISDSTGAASVPANYTCPSTATLTYLVAIGGTVGASTTSNSGLALMAAVGPCNQVTTTSTFVIDEATSVAAVYALAPFYSGGQIGATSTNLTGLTNAFLTASTLANATTGSTSGTALPANAITPAARVNSIANALNACLVKTSACTALYAQGTSGTPANTLDALYNLAVYPGKAPASLYAQSLLSTAYSPALTAAPADWAMFIHFTGGGMSVPSTVGVDSTGSVWVSNFTSQTVMFYSTASKFAPTGAPVFPTGIMGSGLAASYGLAVDSSDNVWIANEPTQVTGSSVTELNSAGASLSGANGYTAGGLSYPLAIAIDPNGTTWVVDFGNSHLTLLNKSGVPLSGATGYTTPLFAFPVAIAIDGNHNAWVTNLSDTTVTRITPDGSDFRNYQCCRGASGLAIDANNNVWIADYYGDRVSVILAGATAANQTYTGVGSIYHPQGIAVDGAGNIFVANFRAGYLTELAGANSSSPGASISVGGKLGADANLLLAYSLAVDASGNVWVANQGNDRLTKFIGVATPVKTPLALLPRIP